MPAPDKLNITKMYHPSMSILATEQEKWRYCYQGGELFRDNYLEQFSTRESPTDFATRKSISYCPAFAKQGINEIKNSIYQRMLDIVRVSMSNSYKRRVQGFDGGVDANGATMNYFMGCTVLPELLVMQTVGIYIDMPKKQGTNLLETKSLKPYVYIYRREQILNWTRDEYGGFSSLLLEDNQYDYDPVTSMPIDFVTRFRYLWIEGGTVNYQFYDANGEQLPGENGTFNLSRIPFYMATISHSLMQDIADYQIALLNIASSDIAYITKANFPLYVEQYDPNVENAQFFIKGAQSFTDTTEGSASETAKAQDKETLVGVTKGRRVPKGVLLPEFIHPSSEPLTASIAKQEQMKKEIRSLLYLSLSNLEPTRSSADSKQIDIGREENGLSYIGQALESAERFIAEIWAEYENITDDVFVKYPNTYEIKPLNSRIATGIEGLKLVEAVPSLTFRKETLKSIAQSVLGTSVPEDIMMLVMNEIDEQEAIIVNPENLNKDVEQGLVSSETASEIRGYPEGEVEEASQEKIERAAAIAEAQSVNKMTPNDNPAMANMGARGVRDMSADPKAEVESERTNADGSKKPKRGKGKAAKAE